MRHPTDSTDLPDGITLSKTVTPPEVSTLSRIAWSRDGKRLALPSRSGSVQIWNAELNVFELSIQSNAAAWATGVAWSPKGDLIGITTGDKRIRLWKTAKGTRVRTRHGARLRLEGTTIAWANGTGLLALGRASGGFEVWNTDRWTKIYERVDDEEPSFLAWSNSGEQLGVAYRQHGRIDVCHIGASTELRELSDDCGPVNALAWAPDDALLASGSGGRDRTIRFWNIANGKEQQRFEGHTAAIRSISFSADGDLLASKAADDTVRIWSAGSGKMLVVLDEPARATEIDSPNSRRPAAVAFHPTLPMLATLGAADTAVRIWSIDRKRLLRATPSEQSLRYTTARIALLGDSGVGKTGLGWRLSHDEFKEHSSTHGQQFWNLPALSTSRADGTECEAMLWDLAGQPDYRLVHALLLDEVDLALILFDPGNRQEALRGVEYWLKALNQSRRRERSIVLVGARLDRAEPQLTAEDLKEFCEERGISGGYIGTSAASGQGVAELINLMKQHIAWNSLVATVTTATFKRVKDFVLTLKEGSPRILIDPNELLSSLTALDMTWEFTKEQMMVAVQHLANHGYVSILDGSDGKQRILLAPQMLANLASSLILEARRNPKGLGAIEEERLLRGDYQFPEVAGLAPAEAGMLIDGVAQSFLAHNVCFRETLGSTTFLIFPSLINQRKPALGSDKTVDDVSYVISGAVETIYASLVVLLGYTNTFTRTNQWQNQAQYEIASGDICGIRQTSERDGDIHIVHYYSERSRPQTRALFQALFESFLEDRQVNYFKYAVVQCTECGYTAEREEVIRRTKGSKTFIFCGECGAKIILTGNVIPSATSTTSHSKVELGRLERDQKAAAQRTLFETAMVRVKAYLRDHFPKKSAPTCFLSYAWDDPKMNQRALQLAADLQDAGVQAIIDRKDNVAIGLSVARFISDITKSDFVVVIGTPAYQNKYENTMSETGSIVAAEMDLINVRLTSTEEIKRTVLPLVFSGDERASLPPLMHGRVFGDFRAENAYFESLLNLILTIHAIPFQEALSLELVQMMRTGAENPNN